LVLAGHHDLGKGLLLVFLLRLVVLLALFWGGEVVEGGRKRDLT
jgi:hypothetical protein